MINKIIIGTLFLWSSNVFCSGMLTMARFQRINNPINENVSDNFIQFDFDEEREGGRWDLSYEGSLRHYTENQGLMFSISEAYLSKNNGRTEYTLGRKVIDWNANDKFWSMGEISPLKSFNLLRTKREGLLGFHFNRKTHHSELTLFGSLLNVPQINPGIKVNEGNITGANEWSYPPPSFIRFRNNDIPVYYEIYYPNISEILIQESFAFKFDYKIKKENKLSIYGGYKPEPVLRTIATGYYDQLNEERVNIQAKPFVNHQTFYGLSYNFNFKERRDETSLTIAFDGVLPERGTDRIFDDFDSLKVQPVYERVSYGTISIRKKSDLFSGGLNYIHLIEGGGQNPNVFAKKVRWKRAIGLNLDWLITGKTFFRADYKFDIKDKSMTFLSSVGYQLSRKLIIGAEFQVLNVPDNTSFWAPFRSNDSLLMKMSYMF